VQPETASAALEDRVNEVLPLQGGNEDDEDDDDE
jgi:hypothetical protein